RRKRRPAAGAADAEHGTTEFYGALENFSVYDASRPAYATARLKQDTGGESMLRRTLFSFAGAVALATATLAAPAAQAEWPERPITIIVPWGAGGGTDAVGRIIGSLMEQELGQPVNVVNRTGGSGV